MIDRLYDTENIYRLKSIVLHCRGRELFHSVKTPWPIPKSIRFEQALSCIRILLCKKGKS